MEQYRTVIEVALLSICRLHETVNVVITVFVGVGTLIIAIIKCYHNIVYFSLGGSIVGCYSTVGYSIVFVSPVNVREAFIVC